MMLDQLLTPEQAAERLLVHKDTILEWLRSGQLKGRKAGRLWRIRERDLEAFLVEPEPTGIEQTCPVCQHGARVRHFGNTIEGRRVECPQCGTYDAEGILWPMFQTVKYDAERQLLRTLSDYLKEKSERNHIVTITQQNWRLLAGEAS
jgi:excisionase family DNA binding protein